MQLLVAMALLLTALSAQAVIETYEFKNEANRERFKELTAVLRCPKCQNNNLADSNAPIAADMRREIHRMLEEGQTKQDVVDFMVARYGDFVNYVPRRDSSTALLWFGPVVLLLVGLAVVVVISRRRRAGQGKPQVEVSAEERERLRKLIDEER
ncbi:cytochrome c-type biogenesis protein [Motiliproteus sp. SC1-56]|uniref:cytochrome c-type biogenesis protein n=1 Tax=Motiliproteus sp. SC1-56 TaxID=2799565 RepID=UPI001A8ED733|nr:cytochrome c-type biogenesis protein [Motiliproteus sp. SC1-56]